MARNYGNIGGVLALDNYRRFFALLVLSCFAYSSLMLSFAVESSPAPDASVPAPVEEVPLEAAPPADIDSVTIEDGKNVYHIEADTIIIQPVSSDADTTVEIPPEDSETPSEDSEVLPETVQEPEVEMEAFLDISAYSLADGDFPFYGSCWVRGSTPDLGEITLFFPTNYKDGYIGLDSSGRLFNVSNNSWSGVLYVNSSGVSYTVNFGSFGLPTYRRYSGSSYTNVTLYLTPQDGNIVFPDGPSPVYSLADLLPYLSILLLGGVFLCSMRKL